MKKYFHPIILLISLSISACTTNTNPQVPLTDQNLLKDRRTHSVIVADKEIESDAYEELNDDKDILEQCHVTVNAYNGATLITGEVPTEELKTKVLATVQVINNVKLIHDHLTIAEPSDLASQENDKIITQTVKKALKQIRSMHEFDPNTLKVVSENGVVYLMGLVQRDEGKVVINLTKLQPGIKQIVTVLEYID